MRDRHRHLAGDLTSERLAPCEFAAGGLAGVGLLLLLAGAMVAHVRNDDGPREVAPSVVCAMLVAGYLAVLAGAA